MHTGAVGLDNLNADDAQRELENAVKEVLAWEHNQKALQIRVATMHTNASLTMQRRLRLMRGSPTAPMTLCQWVLRLGHRTLFFDERYAPFVQLSSDITERMDSDPSPSAVFLQLPWLALEPTATRPGWIAHVPRHEVHARTAAEEAANLEVPALSSDSSARFAFYGADTGDGT